ncbi:MAG: hypothetical protein ACOC2G_02985 [Bacillota bacterium]
MDIQEALALEPEIRRIIELSLEEKSSSAQTTAKEEEFYGQQSEPFTDNNPFLGVNGFESQNSLLDYLEKLSNEELMIILSLVLTGRDIAREDIEEDNLGKIEDIYAEHYDSIPEEKGTLIDYILEEKYDLDKFLTNGLMYCM